MLEEIKRELTTGIIPFWRRLRDDQFGGYYGYLDFDLNLDKQAEKGCILNSRILWFFSRAYLELKEKALLNEADHAYHFLREACLDQENGGIFWSMTYDGKPLDATKHTYNQAFAIYALSAYFEASGNQEALQLAYDLFELIEEKCRDKEGYLEAFDEKFEPVSNEKLSENGVVAGRTMNTALHVLEAYTLLYKVAKKPEMKQSVGCKLTELLRIVYDKIFNPKKRRQEVFFDLNYNSLLDLHSYGHDIEASWLIDLALDQMEKDFLSEEELKNMRAMNLVLAEETYALAYKDGSFANECQDGKVDENRIWWVQSEAMVGFINAYARSGEEKFLEAAESIWDFTKKYVIDKRGGSEWFWEVNPDGSPIERAIVEPWKCPYHNGRMCFELMSRL